MPPPRGKGGGGEKRRPVGGLRQWMAERKRKREEELEERRRKRERKQWDRTFLRKYFADLGVQPKYLRVSIKRLPKLESLIDSIVIKNRRLARREKKKETDLRTLPTTQRAKEIMRQFHGRSKGDKRQDFQGRVLRKISLTADLREELQREADFWKKQSEEKARANHQSNETDQEAEINKEKKNSTDTE